VKGTCCVLIKQLQVVFTYLVEVVPYMGNLHVQWLVDFVASSIWHSVWRENQREG